jgi:hypothetical protein
MAKLFIASSLVFFILGCIEGMMFPTKFQFQSLYAATFHVSPEHIKSFFGHFVAKIHTHVNLIGWVGSALMGILYYIVPQISGVQRYRTLAAYGNWACQITGIVLLTMGFHLIGIFGLASGYPAGSEGFRTVAAPFKLLVILGGVLITVSALLFAFNMIGTLFGKAPSVGSEEKSPRASIPQRIRAANLAVSMLVLFVPAVAFVQPVSASPAPAPRQMDVIMIGDRLVDVSHSLGVVPAAMSVRCSLWPLCKPLQSAVQVLGCPNCLTKKKAAPLLKFSQKQKIKRVLIEKSDPFCTYVPGLRLEKIASFLDSKGFDIQYVDFTQGLETAVRLTADLLGCVETADGVLADYTKAMEKSREKIAGQQFARTVVILRGTYQAATGKTFLRVEAPGGYADRFLLKPMGIENVGGKVVAAGKKPSKGHVAVRKLDGLIAAAPEAIVMTGDAIAVQKVLADAVNSNPSLAEVPAIKAHAIYSLPGYIDSSVVEYPLILRRWADALGRK